MSHTGTSTQNGSSQTPWRAVLSQTGLPPHSSTCTKVHGLDCELVHTMNGLEVARARIEDMHYFDTSVLPQYEIVSLNTAFSGITMDLPFGPLECCRYEAMDHKNVFTIIERSSTTLKGASTHSSTCIRAQPGVSCQLQQQKNANDYRSKKDIRYLDTFVLPQYEIVSLNTAFSGITLDLPFGPLECYRYEAMDHKNVFTIIERSSTTLKGASSALAVQLVQAKHVFEVMWSQATPGFQNAHFKSKKGNTWFSNAISNIVF
ncbi:unnamed protein product [Caenorhabditis nigoni]